MIPFFQHLGFVVSFIEINIYACLGVGKFEQTVLNPAKNEFLEQILLWKRYIDDILMLFKGSREDCQNFVDWLNSLLLGVLQFKYE